MNGYILFVTMLALARMAEGVPQLPVPRPDACVAACWDDGSDDDTGTSAPQEFMKMRNANHIMHDLRQVQAALMLHSVGSRLWRAFSARRRVLLQELALSQPGVLNTGPL